MPSPWSSWSSSVNVYAPVAGGDLQREHLTVARIKARRAGVNKRRQQVAGDVVNNRRTNRRQVLRQTRRVRRQRDGPGLVGAKRHQRASVPVATVDGAGRVRRRIGIAARQQILIHRLRHRAASCTGMSFSTLIVKPPVSGTKSPSASVATRIDERLIASSASSLSFVPSPWSSWSSSVNV